MEEKSENKLNEKQLLFCNLYVSKEFFGNGVRAYAEAYGLDIETLKGYNSAKHSASVLLDDINISKHINNLLDEAGLNDNFADKRLLFLMSQNEDKSTALAAIKEYNKLRQRITDKIEAKITGSFDITMNLDK